MAKNPKQSDQQPPAGLDRRSFVRWAMASLVGGRMLTACSDKKAAVLDLGSGPDDIVTPDLGMDLTTPDMSQPEIEEALAEVDTWTPAPTQRLFAGFKGLADLPYFDLDGEGNLVCTVPDLPPIIDAHVHFGFAYAFSPSIDLNAVTNETLYYFNCDGQKPVCTVDLDLYANKCASQAMLDKMNDEISLTLAEAGSDYARTHTIPNLLAEMDRLGIQKSVVLPIALNLEFGDNATREWLNAIRNVGALDRLIPFGSVHPDDPDKITKLREYADLGIRGIKVHPTMQRIFPDSDTAMEIYAEAERLNLPVLWHSGRAGIEPALMQTYAIMDRYVRPIQEFPNVHFILGHAGAALDWEQALLLARDNNNVWLDVSGPSIPAIQTMLEVAGPSKMMYATDWAFYPQALALAKVLIATHGNTSARDQILHHTAAEVIGL